MSIPLTERTVLLLAQGWNGTLRSLRNFAVMNNIDWNDVESAKDTSSSSVEAYAEAVVNEVLEDEDKFSAYLDEIGYKRVSALVSEINNDLEKHGYTLMDLDDSWEFVKMAKKKTKVSKENLKSKLVEEDRQVVDSSNQKKWDVFISYASEDKIVATPLAEELKGKGLEVWYDKFVLRWGDSLMESINSGLRDSLYGIVILSKSFFQKKWAMTELKALYNLANATGEKKILPLLYQISHKEITEQYPILSDIIARSWDDGLDSLAKEVKEIVDEKKKN